MKPLHDPSPHTIEGDPRFLLKELVVFLVLASLFSWAVIAYVIGQIPPDFEKGNLEAVQGLFGNFPMLFGFGPFFSAIVVTLVYRGKVGVKTLFDRVVRWRVSPWWFLASLVLPIAPQWIGLLVWGKMTDVVLALPTLGNYLSSWLQIALISAVYFISEELGWRGFMLPRVLATRHWIVASFIVGTVWAIWHYPYWITESWLMSESWLDTGVSLLVSSFRAIAISIVITWIFKNTNGSVLLAMILHGSNNANMGKMYQTAGDTALHGPSFQVALACAWIAFAILLVWLVYSKSAKDTVLKFGE